MTDQTPSGNRWEPTDQTAPIGPSEAIAADAAPEEPPPATETPTGLETPPPASAVPEQRGRWRALLRRPGRQGWLAAGVSALMVFVGLGGFLAGRASVDDSPAPTEVGQQWRHGPDDGDLPDRPFSGDPDGDRDGSAPDSLPGSVPGTQS